ncbi:phosphoribosylglycinamide synthetase [Novosphingobium album (ex Liu et al. 2023)]|uniref:Phosphoribosylglycinamide synthetase n=1 Tax=Novosphingobium album (ex Liu et al. 2023) TaxID=3031130 RepID=A0ABT5WLH5_9SPHN|nr:phosphoribosylglycinamide synthetase [Novosphingobium album (ex Liu et al. 2023)]MDE8650898.1 phosphoribosylglycinamide synthetase [Novosphingobium album (ex Liu et al. 2023)]
MQVLTFGPRQIARIPAASLERLTVLFIAKHVFWQGGLHHEDGNHAVYHREIRDMLTEIGVRLQLADSYEALFADPGCDFIFPLLNRGGFLNSEMLLPLLSTRLGIPFLGASPILRGLSDDKHLTKLEARSRGVPTAPWAIYRRAAPIDAARCPRADRLVIKPNASSASWGVRDAGDWAGTQRAIEEIHAEGHDAIVEPFIEGSDVEVPVITCGGLPSIMPMMLFRQADPAHLRTYFEKRDLVEREAKYSLDPFDNEGPAAAEIADYTRALAGVFFPFDYGRFEFRFDERTGQVTFLEVNLNCNLWSEKVFGRSAALLGWRHADLIETILCESLLRHGLIETRELAAA